MATSRFIDGTGFNAGTYGPPYTLGKSYERTYELTVFSRIWGIDHYEYTETGAQIPIPKSYKVKVDIGMMGSWVMLSIDECLHPLHALTRPQNTPPEKAAGKVGETWYEYPWAKTDGVWKDSEIDAFPDRIYFDEMLPKEILQYGNIASQHSVPLAEYKYNLDYIAEDKWMVVPGVQDTMGKLVITDTGEMEIWGNFDWEVTKTTKYKDGDTEKYSYSNEVVMTHGFQTHWPSDKYSKPAKTADQEDYYVGFHSFSLVFKLNSTTYGDRILYGYIDPKELPTKATECNRITKNGLNLDKLHNVYAETIITKDDKANNIKKDTEAMIDYKKHLKENRIRSYLYRTVKELKMVLSEDAQKKLLATLLKELHDNYAGQGADTFISSDDMVGAGESGSGGGSDAGEDAGDDSKMETDD